MEGYDYLRARILFNMEFMVKKKRAELIKQIHQVLSWILIRQEVL
jgi:hypothetical protein